MRSVSKLISRLPLIIEQPEPKAFVQITIKFQDFFFFLSKLHLKRIITSRSEMYLIGSLMKQTLGHLVVQSLHIFPVATS